MNATLVNTYYVQGRDDRGQSIGFYISAPTMDAAFDSAQERTEVECVTAVQCIDNQEETK